MAEPVDPTLLSRALRDWQANYAGVTSPMGPRTLEYLHRQQNQQVPLTIQQNVDRLQVDELKRQGLLPSR
jgi:hypothetical protein